MIMVTILHMEWDIHIKNKWKNVVLSALSATKFSHLIKQISYETKYLISIKIYLRNHNKYLNKWLKSFFGHVVFSSEFCGKMAEVKETFILIIRNIWPLKDLNLSM